MGTQKQIKERTQKQTNQKPTSLVPVHRSGREAVWCLIVILRTSTAEKITQTYQAQTALLCTFL